MSLVMQASGRMTSLAEFYARVWIFKYQYSFSIRSSRMEPEFLHHHGHFATQQVAKGYP